MSRIRATSTGASAELGEESTKQFAMMNPVNAFGKRANAELDRCDIFLQNAGLGGYDWKETKDGYERTLQVNVISTYWLGELLLPLLQKTASLPSPSSTILKPHMSIVGSFVHFLASFPEQNEEKPLAVLNDKSRFGAMDRYNVSKLLVLYATRELADQAYPEVVVNFNNPGFAMTEFTNEMSFGMRMFTNVLGFFFARTAAEGAKPLVWGCLNDTSPAAFISNSQEVEVSDFALSKESDAAAKRFMDEVREVIKEQDAKHP